MATVTSLCDRVCQVTGLSETGSDRSQVLGYLNQAYAYTVLEAGNYTSTFSVALTSGTDDYTLADLGISNALEIRNLWITDSSVTARPLSQVSEQQIISLRQGQASQSTPLMYAMRGTQQVLLFPKPGSGVTLAGSYLAEPLTLVESGAVSGTSEATPTAIPSPFHYDVLANKATALAMEYDNRFEEAANYDAKWGVAMERLLAWVNRFGGPAVHSGEDIAYDGPRDMDLR